MIVAVFTESRLPDDRSLGSYGRWLTLMMTRPNVMAEGPERMSRDVRNRWS